jgi:hypothetical protein
MKGKFLGLAAAALLLCSTSAAQTNSAKPSSTKRVISGKVSADGKTLVGDHTTWLISNPAAILGREGHLVKLKVRLDEATNQIRVLAVSLLDSRTQYAANHGDSAFRR